MKTFCLKFSCLTTCTVHWKLLDVCSSFDCSDSFNFFFFFAESKWVIAVCALGMYTVLFAIILNGLWTQFVGFSHKRKYTTWWCTMPCTVNRVCRVYGEKERKSKREDKHTRSNKRMKTEDGELIFQMCRFRFDSDNMRVLYTRNCGMYNSKPHIVVVPAIRIQCSMRNVFTNIITIGYGQSESMWREMHIILGTFLRLPNECHYVGPYELSSVQRSTGAESSIGRPWPQLCFVMESGSNYYYQRWFGIWKNHFQPSTAFIEVLYGRTYHKVYYPKYICTLCFMIELCFVMTKSESIRISNGETHRTSGFVCYVYILGRYLRFACNHYTVPRILSQQNIRWWWKLCMNEKHAFESYHKFDDWIMANHRISCMFWIHFTKFCFQLKIIAIVYIPYTKMKWLPINQSSNRSIEPNRKSIYDQKDNFPCLFSFRLIEHKQNSNIKMWNLGTNDINWIK